MGLIVPSGFCSETNTDSQERHTATILASDSDLLIEYEKETEGHHHCSKVFWLWEDDTRAKRPPLTGNGLENGEMDERHDPQLSTHRNRKRKRNRRRGLPITPRAVL